MGLEMWYQALPPDSGLIELARSDPDAGASLALVPFWFSREDIRSVLSRKGERDDRLWDACCRLLALHPDLRTRNCHLAKDWDELHYLLSATRRDEAATAKDLAIDRAFNAGELIADHVVAGQGVPVRYLSPGAVSDIAAVVEPLDRDSLARHYDPVRMEEQCVYSFWAESADAAGWEWTVRRFTAFRSFFLAAARAGDAVIVCKD